jgi:acyl-CoA synthetase (AMP-forming)/AMP-acid ligase II
MLSSAGRSNRNVPLLRPLEGVSYAFLPIAPEKSTESGHQSNARMLELVILSESGDCPDISLRQSDGHFHTGDLFQEPTPGAYVFRGRDDDWIKSENSLRCDTKFVPTLLFFSQKTYQNTHSHRAIEDNVRLTCGDLIQECVVVGSGRPSPALFIEPATNMDPEKLKKEIIRKTRQFHSRRYLHERVTSTDMIIVVPRTTLPRTATKGNIRRKAVEEAYKVQLDQIYGVAQ